MAIVSFPRRLADLAAAAPDPAAVTCDGASVTRGELESRANRLARDLAGRGVGHGDFVTVALPNSIDWFVAYVACWKLGAVPQPVSAKLPPASSPRSSPSPGRRSSLGADAGRAGGTDVLAGRLPPARRPGRRPAAGRHVTGVEGADLGRVDRPAEADRVRRPGAARHRTTRRRCC